MKLHNDFIGVNDSNTILSFLPSDTEETYQKNLLSEGDSWYYKTAKITYEINENGHRCKSINDINLDNYILFAGCSHTLGIGLELDKTYPFMVSHLLGCDYYNLGMPGAGIDVLEYNLLMWFSKVKKNPKL